MHDWGAGPSMTSILAPILRLPRRAKRTIALGLDITLCVLSVWIAYYLRLGEWVYLSQRAWPAVAGSVVLAIPVFIAFGLYRTVYRFVSWEALVAVVQAVALYGVIYATLFTVYGIDGVPRTVGIIQPILLLILVGGARASVRHLAGAPGGRVRRDKKQVLIYGVGSAGRQLAAAIAPSASLDFVGYLDDDRNLQGSVVGGSRVWPPAQLPLLIDRFNIDEVFLAIPSATRARRNEILQSITAARVGVRSLPGLMDLADGTVTTSDLQPLEIEDLLGRDPVPPDLAVIAGQIAGQTVLVTGAGGSIGSELSRQIIALNPARLLLVDSSEFALYAIHGELVRVDAGHLEGEMVVIPLLASVTDERRIDAILDVWKPAIVFHAAAYKHVPLVEHNVIEGVRNNVVGTWTCARLAQKHGVARFILISTDKAVRPTNVMGASKRMAELVLQAMAARRTATCFAMVRFGNVLGSSGSVVPLFRRQIAAGGPVTVTHRDVTRYFMTIPEAAQLVLQASTMARGGEVFVLDMGEPVRVYDLARRMIELSGLTVRDADAPDGDIDIVFTELRPGEKLYEELLIGNSPRPTAHPRVMTANEHFLPADVFDPVLDDLRTAIAHGDVVAIRAILLERVDGFVPASEIVDWVATRRTSAAAAIISSEYVGVPSP